MTGDGLLLHGNPMAINAQSLPEGYDFEAALAALLVQESDATVDTTELPLPEQVEP